MSYIVNNPETKVSQTSIELNQNNQHMQILIAPHHSFSFCNVNDPFFTYSNIKKIGTPHH
jgi:hypothetical protein